MRHHHLRSSLLTALVLLVPQAAGQSDSHPLSVSVPSYIGLRILGAGAAAPRSVVFDFATDPIAYIAASDAGQPLEPTSVNRFDDVEVNVIGIGRWNLHVEATAFEYEGHGTGSGLDLSDVRMDRGSTSGLTQNAITVFWFFGAYDTSWTLATAPRRIARSILGTNGWRSLGFNGWDYTLAVDGDEDAGSYTTTVTYFLTFP